MAFGNFRIWDYYMRQATFAIAVSLFQVAAGCSLAQTDLLVNRSCNIDLYGNIYVIDAVQNTLTLMTKARDTIRTIGGAGWQDSQFDRPAAVWAQNGIDVFVADYGNHRIQRFDRSLSFVSSFSTRESENAEIRFGYPTGVALSRLGDLYICDSENARCLKVNRSNAVERSFGGFDAGEGRLIRPSQLACGPDDRVYVLDESRIVVFDAFGNYLQALHPDLLTVPTALFATADRVVVGQGKTIFCFDRDGRPLWNASAEGMVGADGRIDGICLADDAVLVLCRTGLHTLPLPQ
jgi:DNA-binding beta-propeller fold protein YncE